MFLADEDKDYLFTSNFVVILVVLSTAFSAVTLQDDIVINKFIDRNGSVLM